MTGLIAKSEQKNIISNGLCMQTTAQ